MRGKTIIVILVAMAGLSCRQDSPAPPDPEETAEVYPVPPSRWMQSGNTQYYSSGFVGDPMPFYDQGKFHVFYLHDARDGKPGFHPVHKFSGTSPARYTYDGLMVDYAGENDQDLAIGTGSVVKAGNTYFCYYTGHNYLFPNKGLPKEGLMYATGTDLKTWTKKAGFNLIAPPGYDRHDFRDPHVFYNNEKGEYWMLVSARKDGKAVVALFTSKDLSSDKWQLQDPLYTSDNDAYFMLECADIFKWGEHWYLTFSENNVEKTTHYRMSTSSSGPWETPEKDVLDGEFFYAGKTASDGTDRYLFGWVHTKEGNTDYGARQWAGNLVTHQLVRNANGTLSVKIPEAVKGVFSRSQPLNQKTMTQAEVRGGNDYTVRDGGRVSFQPLRAQRKIKVTLRNMTEKAEAGFLLAYNKGNDFYKVRFRNNWAYIVKVQGNDEYIDAKVPYEGTDLTLEMVIDRSVLVVEINGKTTLTGRSYWMPDADWGLYSLNETVSFQGLTLYSQ